MRRHPSSLMVTVLTPVCLLGAGFPPAHASTQAVLVIGERRQADNARLSRPSRLLETRVRGARPTVTADTEALVVCGHVADVPGISELWSAADVRNGSVSPNVVRASLSSLRPSDMMFVATAGEASRLTTGRDLWILTAGRALSNTGKLPGPIAFSRVASKAVYRVSDVHDNEDAYVEDTRELVPPAAVLYAARTEMKS
jgi:hypothetical protein